jgi:hypothetical protein
MEAAWGARVILDYYKHDPLTLSGCDTADGLPRGARAVHGHFRPHRYDCFKEAFRLTFLREPVDNLISIYCYWKSCPEHGNHVHSRFLAEQPSIFEFATYGGLQTLASETYFGGYDMGRFDFIGFHETRAQDLPELASLLGLPLGEDVHENRTSGNERQELASNPQIIAHLKTCLSKDINFYESLFAARKA